MRARRLARGILADDPALDRPRNGAAERGRARGLRRRGRLAAQGLTRPPPGGPYTAGMRTAELIATHGNTDFDAFAAMVAARKLYPEAAISLGGAVNRNVREFQALYADLIPVVEPRRRRARQRQAPHPRRHGPRQPARRAGADLCAATGVQVVAFDHHALGGDLPAFIRPDNLVTSDRRGAGDAAACGIIAERGIADHARSRRPCSRSASTRTPAR